MVRPASSRLEVNPVQSTTRSITIPGGSLRLREVDPADAPRGHVPALLLHGGPGGTDYLFKFFARPLLNVGYRAVGLIQRGSAGSPHPGPYTVDEFVDDVESVRRDITDGPVAIIGHSWGGLLATAYAARYPKHVERLMLICPIGPSIRWKQPFRDEIQRRLSPENRQRTAELKAAADAAPTPDERGRLLTQRAAIEMMTYYAEQHRTGKPGLAALESLVREAVLADMDKCYARADWLAGLRDLDAPCSVLYGEEDTVPTFVAQEYRALLPEPVVIGLDHCGHFPWMEEEEMFWRAFGMAMDGT